MKLVRKNVLKMKTFITWSGPEQLTPNVSELNDSEIRFEEKLQLDDASCLKGMVISLFSGGKWVEHTVYNWDWLDSGRGEIVGVKPIFTDSEKFNFKKDLSMAQC